MIIMKIIDNGDDHEDDHKGWLGAASDSIKPRATCKLAESPSHSGILPSTSQVFAKYLWCTFQILPVIPMYLLGIFQVLYRYCQVISGISAFPSYLPNMFQLQIFKYFQVFAKPFPGICLVLYHVFPSNFRYLLSTYRVFVKYFSGIC